MRPFTLALLVTLLALGLLGGCGLDELGSPDITEPPSDDPRVEPVVETVQPSVVGIRASGAGGAARGMGVGTGVILRSDGLIVTNDHVITMGEIGGEPAANIEVELPGGERRPAQVVGRDPSRDLAFLDVEGTDMVAATLLENLGDVRQGDFVVAFGIASVLDEPISTGQVVRVLRGVRSPALSGLSTLITSSVPLEQGYSGGPLADEQGRVIGINLAMTLEEEGEGPLGSGFAVPAPTVLETMEEVLD